MLPVMLAARRLDSEDPQTVYWLRIAYGVIQTLCILAVAYTYYKANMAIGIRNVVYVPPPPQVSECLTFIYNVLTFVGSGGSISLCPNLSGSSLTHDSFSFQLGCETSFLCDLLRNLVLQRIVSL